MNQIFHSKQENRPTSFFSSNLSPQNHTQTYDFESQFENNPIYFMAQEVKRKISRTPKKQIKRQPKMNPSFVEQDKKQEDANFQTAPTNFTKTTQTSKNLNPKKQRVLNLSNTIEDQRRLLSKITIHRIRSQRQQLQSQTKRISNSYNYLFQRIEKEKRKSIEIKMKKQKVKQIHEKSQIMKRELQIGRVMFLEQKSLEKSRLRDAVLKQKKNRQRSLINFYNNLHKNASQIRLQSQKIDEEILKTELSEMEKKKIKYLTQKQKQKRRLLTREKSFENRRLQAQTQFKQKWLREFNQTSKARKNYISKKQSLNKKMKKLYEAMRVHESPFFESQENQGPKSRVEECKNPEQQCTYW